MPNVADYINYSIAIVAIVIPLLITYLVNSKRKKGDSPVDSVDANADITTCTDPCADFSCEASNIYNIADLRLAYLSIITSWRKGEHEYTFGQIDTTRSDALYFIPQDLAAHVAKKSSAVLEQLESCTDEGKVRLVDYNMNNGKHDLRHLRLLFSKITYKDFLIANSYLDEPVSEKSTRTFRDQYFFCDSLITQNLSNICGVGVFVLTSDHKIIVCKSSKNVAVNPNKYIYSASGTMDWDTNPHDVNPFYDVQRECFEEIGYLPDIEDLVLYAFGLDYAKGYYQFSFYIQTSKTAQQIMDDADMADDFKIEIDKMEALDFNIVSIVNHIKTHNWDQTAAANLITLVSKEFGKDNVSKYINPQLIETNLKKELHEEWNKRAHREGRFAVMSKRYPPEKINKISDDYVLHVTQFIDDNLKDKSVIEVGGGIGLFTKYFAQNAKSTTVVDVSECMIAKSKEYLGLELSAKVRYIHCFFQDYSEKAMYDILVCSLVLIHNFNDLDALIANMKKTAKTIYLFEQIDDGQASKYTKTKTMEEYIRLFPEYTPDKTSVYYLCMDKIGFIKLVRK